jgi:hypothetical protein
MAICCGGKKQKVSHSVTSSIKNRRLSEKHNGILDHQNLKLNNSPRHRSHSNYNHQSTMPHDLSRSSANSASSSALTYSAEPPPPPTTNNNHYHHKNTKKMDMSDDDDEDFSMDDKNKSKHKQNLDRSVSSQYKHTIVHADMIFYCFEILGNYLFNGKHHLGKHHSTTTNGHFSSSPTVPPSLPNDSYPLFVTWLIGSDQKLRGCIGTFTPMNLAQGKTIQISETLFRFLIIIFRSS